MLLWLKNVFGLLNSGIADPLGELPPKDNDSELLVWVGAELEADRMLELLIGRADDADNVALFRRDALLDPAKSELGSMRPELELPEEEVDGVAAFEVFGVALEDVDGPELLARDDKLSDALWIVELELKPAVADIDVKEALADAEFVFDEEAVALKLPFSGTELDDMPERLD